MQQYFGIKKDENVLYLNSEDLNHIKNVMRMKENDKVIISFKGISYLVTLNSSLLSGTIDNIYKSERDTNQVIAYIPILPEEKMSFIIQKGTELGVTEFIPVEFERNKYKLDKTGKEKKLNRWNKIAKEASEQSHRVNKSEVKEIIKVKEITSLNGVNILCSLDNENVKEINEVLTIDNACDKITLVFGPEGGITQNEEKTIESLGFTKTRLVKNVLRSETVIIFLVSIINYLRK